METIPFFDSPALYALVLILTAIVWFIVPLRGDGEPHNHSEVKLVSLIILIAGAFICLAISAATVAIVEAIEQQETNAQEAAVSTDAHNAWYDRGIITIPIDG